MVRRCKALCYKSFLRRKNNFALHFVDNFFGNCYRRGEAYRKCAQENKNNFLSLAENLRRRNDYESPEYAKALYQLYILLHEYVEDDADLFN